jgi:hypothetical protein
LTGSATTEYLVSQHLQVLVQPAFNDVRQACFCIPWAPLVDLIWRITSTHDNVWCPEPITSVCVLQVLVQPPFDYVHQACL